MSDKRKNKFKVLKIIFFIIVLLYILNMIWSILRKYNMSSENITKEFFGGVTVSIAEDKFEGEYDIQKTIIPDELCSKIDFDNRVLSYEDYIDYCERNNLNQKYTNIFCNYAIVTKVIRKGYNDCEIELAAVENKSNNGIGFNSALVHIYYINKDEQQLENKKYTVIIPVSKFIKYVNTASNVFSREEYEKIKDKPIDLTCAN